MPATNWPSTLKFDGADLFLEVPRYSEAIYKNPHSRNNGTGEVLYLMLGRSGHCKISLPEHVTDAPTVRVDRWPDDKHRFRWALSFPLTQTEWAASLNGTLTISSEGVDLTPTSTASGGR